MEDFSIIKIPPASFRECMKSALNSVWWASVERYFAFPEWHISLLW